MDKIKFIELYQKKINGILPEFRQEHFIDNDKIGCLWIKNWIYYDIDNCIKIMSLTKEARQYIYNLKKGDKIKVNSYGNITEVEILKINYKRSLSKKGNKIISSIGYKEILGSGSIYQGKIKIKEIIYQGNNYQDLFDSYLHFSGYFLSFSNYDINSANKILDNYNKEVIK